MVGLLHKKLLEQKYLHIDETPVQVMNEPDRKNAKDSYMWVYCSIKDSGQPVRQFVYQPGRSGTYPQEYLKGYHGFIHTDAYKGYEKVSGLTRCICWTHLRRYFVEALPKDVDSPEATIPARAVRYINQFLRSRKNWRFYPLQGGRNSVWYRKSLYWMPFGCE